MIKMKDDIIDDLDEDNAEGNKMVAIKYFYFESKARLYSARLETEGIPSFVSNSNAITAVPLGSPGIGLHVKQRDYEAARQIVLRMDQRAEMEIIDDDDESFRDADHEDIEYQRKLTERDKGDNKTLTYLIAIIIVLVIIRVIWRIMNPGDAWGPF
ncbi:MAG: hypothetical protein AB8F74_17615 [Saprospiraceae bacterium]